MEVIVGDDFFCRKAGIHKLIDPFKVVDSDGYHRDQQDRKEECAEIFFDDIPI